MTKMTGRRVARSIKGEVVDFDLLEMKEKMAANPKPVDVKKREDFIDQKLRRKSKSSIEELKQKALEQKKQREAQVAAAAVVESTTDAPKKKIKLKEEQ